MDLYAGIMWSQVQNGLANGFLQTNPSANGARHCNERPESKQLSTRALVFVTSSNLNRLT